MTDHSISLEDIATHDVACLSVAATLGEAANLMAQRRFSSIVVVDDSRHPVGIVTERNILKVMHDRVPLDSPLRVGMSAPVITMHGDKDCLEAYQECLRAGIRHLVLVDDRNVVTGVVSETDFRSHLGLTALAGRRKISSIAKHSAIVLPPSCALTQAIELMQTQRKSCVIVVENEKPVGIVTERDMVRFYSGERSYTDLVLGQVMVAPVLTIPSSATTHQAAETMLFHKVRHLVAVDDEGRMAGLVSEHDLTQVMVGGLAEVRTGIEESFLRILLDTLPDLVWLKDEQGIYLACNRRFEMFFGVQEAEIVGKTDYDFVTKEQADFFRENDRRAMAAGKPSINEEWLTFAEDGYRGLFETIKTPMYDGRRRLNGVLGVARDITERKRTEEALHFLAQRSGADNAESILSDLVRYFGEVLGVDYVLVDKLAEEEGIAETVALYAKGDIIPNMRYELRGTPCDNVIGKQLCCYRQGVQAIFPEDRLLGELQVESYSGIPLWDSQGQPIGLIAVMDGKPFSNEAEVIGLLKLMSVRVAAELERARSDSLLRLREREFQTLTENLPDNIIRYDRDCRVQYMNPSMALTIAHELLPVVGRFPVESAPDSPQIRDLQNLVEQVMDSGELVEVEFEIPHPDGNLHWHHTIFVPEWDKEGKVIGALGIGRDITERKQSEQALRESGEKLRALYELSPLGIALTDMNGKYVEFNEAFRDICGYELEELSKLDYWALTPKKYAEDEARQLASLKRSGRYGPYEKEYIRKDGNLIPLRLNGVLVTGSDGNKYIWSIVEDISESKRSEENLRITASVFENTREAIIITDPGNRIIDVNPAFAEITGYSRDEVLGKNPSVLSSGMQDKTFYSEMWKLLNETGSWRGEIWNRRKSGDKYAELLSVSAIRDDDGRVQRYVGVFSDITYFKEYEAELSHVANYDVLTGIPNRRLLADRLGQAVAVAQRGGRTLAICYVDLDGFKEVNDRYGHEKGDQLLVEVTRRIQHELRAGDTVARLGGDEFIVLFNDLAHEKECFQILERLMQTITTPMQLGKHSVVVSASVGVAFYPEDGEDGDTLLKNADSAMYIAKQNGKNRFHYHEQQA